MKRMIAVLSALISLSLFGCNGTLTKPETPPNNVEDRGHDMPHTTTYTFSEGSLSKETAVGSNGKERKYLADGFTEKDGSKKQVIQFSYNNKTELVRTGNLIMKPDVWYRLEIEFRNKSGAVINNQFIEDEKARSLHQFFFRSFGWENNQLDINRMIKKPLIGNNGVIEHRYGDKFSDGTLIDPPIGFVGYIRFSKRKAQEKNIKKIVLNGVLVHVMSSSKLTYDKKLDELVPHPFDNPSSDIIGVTDIDHRFEVDLDY